jgi:hypothetical protein
MEASVAIPTEMSFLIAIYSPKKMLRYRTRISVTYQYLHIGTRSAIIAQPRALRRKKRKLLLKCRNFGINTIVTMILSQHGDE